MMKPMVYAVFEFAETEGNAIDVFSGYAYDKPELANEHAANVWGGSVRSFEVLSKLPDGMFWYRRKP